MKFLRHDSGVMVPVYDETEEEGQFLEGHTIAPWPVHIASSDAEPVKFTAPEFASCQNYNPIAQTGSVPTQICPRRIRRYKTTINIKGGVAASDTWINTNPNALQLATPQGVHLHIGAAASNNFPDYYAQQPLYAISSQPDVELSILDMSFGEA